MHGGLVLVIVAVAAVGFGFTNGFHDAANVVAALDLGGRALSPGRDVGAIAWNVATWSVGLPSSSSHALIGGVIGAMLAAAARGGV